MVNDKFLQLHGPFAQQEDIIKRIKADYPDFQYIKKLGVQTIPTNLCRINGQIFEMGKTEILEFNEVHITSLEFMQDEPSDTLVDCILG